MCRCTDKFIIIINFFLYHYQSHMYIIVQLTTLFLCFLIITIYMIFFFLDNDWESLFRVEKINYCSYYVKPVDSMGNCNIWLVYIYLESPLVRAVINYNVKQKYYFWYLISSFACHNTYKLISFFFFQLLKYFYQNFIQILCL